jgi:hypothetical protein
LQNTAETRYPYFEVFNKSNAERRSVMFMQVGMQFTLNGKRQGDRPGGSTKITVGYNAAAEGPFTKFITVSYNENQSKQITIRRFENT